MRRHERSRSYKSRRRDDMFSGFEVGQKISHRPTLVARELHVAFVTLRSGDKLTA